MQRALAIGFLLAFTLQVSVKSLVSLYFRTLAVGQAENHCVYKTITICKGSCYVAKQIKIISSSNNSSKNQVPNFDFNSFKDGICLFKESAIVETLNDLTQHSSFGNLTNHYCFQSTRFLLKPPAA